MVEIMIYTSVVWTKKKYLDIESSLGLIVPPKIYHGTYFNDYITGFWSANFEESEGVLSQMGIDAKISKILAN